MSGWKISLGRGAVSRSFNGPHGAAHFTPRARLHSIDGPAMSESLAAIVDLARYPLNDRDGPAWAALVENCREQLARVGFVALDGFLHAATAAALVDEARALQRQRSGFRSTESHNVYLRDDDDLQQQRSTKLLFAADEVAAGSALRLLYEDDGMLAFVRAALERPDLHRSADAAGRFYVNIFEAGDELGWHFDRSAFSVSLILQPAPRGGAFEFAPSSRAAVDALGGTMPPDAAARIGAVAPPLAAGSLYLFQGREACHRVTPVEEGQRVNAIFTFNPDPEEVLNEYTLKKFFGRTRAG